MLLKNKKNGLKKVKVNLSKIIVIFVKMNFVTTIVIMNIVIKIETTKIY